MSNQEIGFQELAQYFHLPIHVVSKELGICATVLKKICRRNGIARWPHRKIKSLDRMLQVLQCSVPTLPEQKAKIQKEIDEVLRKKESILTKPSSELRTKSVSMKKSKEINTTTVRRYNPNDLTESNAFSPVEVEENSSTAPTVNIQPILPPKEPEAPKDQLLSKFLEFDPKNHTPLAMPLPFHFVDPQLKLPEMTPRPIQRTKIAPLEPTPHSRAPITSAKYLPCLLE